MAKVGIDFHFNARHNPKEGEWRSDDMAKEPKRPWWVYYGLVVVTLLLIVATAHLFDIEVRSLSMSYHDLIAVLLTALGVLISVLAVFLAVIAFIGWQNFDRRVSRSANDFLAEGFKPDGALFKDLEERMLAALDQGFKPQGKYREVLEEAVELISYDMGNIGDPAENEEAAIERED